MGAWYCVVNPVKRQYLSINGCGEPFYTSGVITGTRGRSLHSMAIAWLVCRAEDESPFCSTAHWDDMSGAWFGDPVYIASDEVLIPSGGRLASLIEDPSVTLHDFALGHFEDITVRVVASLCEKSSDLDDTLAGWAVANGKIVNVPLSSTLFQAVIHYDCLGIDLALRKHLGDDWLQEYGARFLPK